MCTIAEAADIFQGLKNVGLKTVDERHRAVTHAWAVSLSLPRPICSLVALPMLFDPRGDLRRVVSTVHHYPLLEKTWLILTMTARATSPSRLI
jgi:hypothetical protein